jgi:hypothetical protein
LVDAVMQISEAIRIPLRSNSRRAGRAPQAFCSRDIS